MLKGEIILSHFSVAVFTKDNQRVEDLLAPYQENNSNSCPNEYLAFHDTEDEYKEEFENDTRSEFYCSSHSSWGQAVTRDVFEVLKSREIGDRITLTVEKSGGFGSHYKNGAYYHCYDNTERKSPEEHVWIKVTNIIQTNHPDSDVCFEGIIEVQLIDSPKEIPLKEFYNYDFDYFMKEWARYERKDPTTQRYGYWENPNAKWDWYQIGGRFSGLIKLKENASSGEYGERSWTNENVVMAKNRVDSAKVKDIDFSMDEEEYSKNLRYWELIVENAPPKNKEEEEIINHSFYKPEYYTNRYDSKEQFAQQAAEFGTYAVITPDGVWHSKGEMGWFGFSSESDDEAKNWNKSFKEMFIDNADSEWRLTVIDCHI